MKPAIFPQRPDAGQRRVEPLRGALFMAAAGFAFAALGACVKAASATLSTEMVVFLRSAIGLLVLLPWVARRGWRFLGTRRPLAHLARALFGVAAMYTFFYALARLTLAEAVLLSYTTPLFTPLFAWLWLRERLTRSLVAAALVGFFGVGLILRPEGHFLSLAAWAGLASGALAALAMVAIRTMADTEPPLRVVFYFSLVSTLVALPWAWAEGFALDAAGLGWMVLAGAFASGGQFLVTNAYTHAPAAVVGPFTYTTVLFAAFMGWVFWGEGLDGWTLLGGLAIVVGGVLALRSR